MIEFFYLFVNVPFTDAFLYWDFHVNFVDVFMPTSILGCYLEVKLEVVLRTSILYIYGGC